MASCRLDQEVRGLTGLVQPGPETVLIRRPFLIEHIGADAHPLSVTEAVVSEVRLTVAEALHHLLRGLEGGSHDRRGHRARDGRRGPDPDVGHNLDVNVGEGHGMYPYTHTPTVIGVVTNIGPI